MLPEDKKLVTFAERVYEKTAKGELRWETTSDANAFAVSFPKYSVTIERVPETEDTNESFMLRISNDRGQTIEEFTSWQAQRAGFDHLRELFDRARRIAMGLDEALDDLLEQLDEPRRLKS